MKVSPAPPPRKTMFTIVFKTAAVDQLARIAEAAHSLAEDLSWRDEPQIILDALAEIVRNHITVDPQQ